MKSTLIKNVLCNLAAALLAFVTFSFLHVSAALIFTALTAGGIGLIALHDYRPRRQVRLKPTPAKPAGRPVASRCVSALVAA